MICEKLEFQNISDKSNEIEGHFETAEKHLYEVSLYNLRKKCQIADFFLLILMKLW